MKTRYACAASTGLNWADENHRVLIAHNLSAYAEYLSCEVLPAANRMDREGLLQDLSRIYTRRAVCDLDAARQGWRMMKEERQKDIVCRITLEKMADMAEEAVLAPEAGMAGLYLGMAQNFARVVRDEQLDGWHSTGPYAGLGRLALTVAELDLSKAMGKREALPELIRMARSIPLTQGVDEEQIESQIFRDGLALFRKHQGLERESGRG